MVSFTTDGTHITPSPFSDINVVEFISGVGIVINGVVDDSQGTTGPFTWTPSKYTRALFSGCAGGGGGGAGGVAAGGGSGGGGGAAGQSIFEMPVYISPSTVYTVTVGLGGAAGAHGNDLVITAAGGYIDPVFQNYSVADTIRLYRGLKGNDGIAGVSQVGGAGGTAANGVVAGGTGGAITPTTGGVAAVSTSVISVINSIIACSGSGGGGAGAATASNGGGLPNLGTRSGTSVTGGTNVAAFAGGGVGGISLFGRPSAPGNGNNAGASAATASIGFGAGGSGAGGATTTSTAAAGRDSYFRIVF